MAYNVLIVDDSASMRSIIGKALRLSGLELGEVHEAPDGVRALEVLDEQWIDVVLADLNMPQMGGVELIERMRHKGLTGRVPVIVVSTEGRAHIIDDLLELGAAAFLRKPFPPEELCSVIRSVLEADVSAPEDSLLATAFFEALEGFAMLVGDVAESLPEAPDAAVLAQVAFVGPAATGTVSLAASPSTCRMIGSSATGDELAEEVDALAELANQAAGRLVDRLGGGPFGLQPPTTSETSGNDAWASALAEGRAVGFDVEGRAVILGVDLRKRW